MYTIYLKNSAYKVFVSGVFLLKQCLLNVPRGTLFLSTLVECTPAAVRKNEYRFKTA